MAAGRTDRMHGARESAGGGVSPPTVAYRAYRVASSGRITAGEWLQALHDDDARRQAQDLCDAETPKVEVWQGGRFVATLDCEPPKRVSR